MELEFEREFELDQELEDLDTPNGSQANGSQECDIANQSAVGSVVFYYGGFVVGSLIVLLLLCLSQRRTRLSKNCCWGHMGLPVPMDFLVSPHYRLPYLLVFSVMAMQLLLDLLNISTPSAFQKQVYLNIIFKIFLTPLIVICFLGLKFLPLLACVEAPLLFFGHCIGFLYSLLWLADGIRAIIYSYYNGLCVGGSDSYSSIQLAVFYLSQLPILLIMFCVVLWYAFHVAKGCFSAFHGQGLNSPRPEIEQYMLLRVQRLLSNTPVPVAATRNRLTHLVLKVARYFFPYTKYHRLPLPFLCVVAAMSMFLYQLSVSLAIVGFSLLHNVVDYYDRISDTINITESADEFLKNLLLGIPAAFAISPFVALLLSVLLLLHMMSSISKIVKTIARQGFTETLPAKLSRLPTAWTYLGVQFGFFVYAYFIYLFLSFLLGVVLVVLVIGIQVFTSYVINLALILIIPLVYSRIIFYLQFLVCKFVFFEDAEGKFISITNRRLFNWFAFILFLYNGFAGFVTAIVRVFMSAAISLLLLFRLDTVVMPKGFEFLDFGHRAFLGFFDLHYSYNNAVMHSFVYQLNKTRKHQHGHSIQLVRAGHLLDETATPLLGAVPSAREVGVSHRLCRNRWLVAYTLLRNPSIQELTARNIAKGSKVAPASEEVVTEGRSLVTVDRATRLTDEIV